MSMHSSNSLFRWSLAAGAVALLTLVSGCRQDMQDQPKMVPQRESHFFANGRSVRPQVLGTVARGQLDADDYFYTGLIDEKEQDALPFPVTMTVLRRGQERFDIYCTPCHSRVGNGRGHDCRARLQARRRLHESRILKKPLSHYFRVMTHGYGAMPDYAAQTDTSGPLGRSRPTFGRCSLAKTPPWTDVPAGTNVQSLAEVSQQMGYPANFPQGWTTAGVN